MQQNMYDYRADTDALFHQFHVLLENVIDLQVYEQTIHGYKPSRDPGRYKSAMSIVAPEHITRRWNRATQGKHVLLAQQTIARQRVAMRYGGCAYD